MKIVLFALNGSFSHTNLALRCLRAPLERAGFDVVPVERNLRDRTDEVLQALYTERADLYGFSCYIWNITSMLSLAADLKALLPRSVLVLGGPEVSFDTERFNGSSFSFIDHVIRGEGEDALPALAAAVRDGNSMPRVLDGGTPDVMRDEGILYRAGDCPAGELLYYESSRGCPYRCAYCLSSVGGKIRAKTAEQTLADLRAFERLSAPGKIVKFVDRTFNFDAARANRIWAALAEPEFTGHYHFEICASLLNEESFEIFSRMPKGRIQLEIGLQSTNPTTLAEVSRHIDPASVIAASRRIHDMGNIHVHLDLITGLPFESYARFRQSFNDAWGCCDLLQLGFLKLLHGTRLCADAEKYGYVASAQPPYTVLQSKWITRDELYHLSEIADLLDRYDGSGAFSRTLALAVPLAPTPFDFFDGLDAFLSARDGRSVRRISQTDAFRLLWQYCRSLTDAPDRLSALEDALHADFEARESRKMPSSVLGK